jgi:hypothetical protein
MDNMKTINIAKIEWGRDRLFCRLAALILGLAIVCGFASAGFATETGFLLSAGAYGTRLNVGNLIKSGPTALSSVGGGCGTTQVPAHSDNTAATLNLPPEVVTGAIDTSADLALSLGGTLRATATADTHDIALLGGLIIAAEVKAVSTTTHDTTGFHRSAAGSELVGAVIDGNAITIQPAPNTRIDLAGIGHVVLNEQTKTSDCFTVNMIHVFVTQANVVINNVSIPVGTQIIVSHAISCLSGPGFSGTLDGSAYGTKANVGNIIISGPTAQVGLGCLGTDGVLKQNEILQVQVPNLFSVGDVVDTAQGTVNATSATGETTSTIQAINVLSNLVKANLVKADAHASKVNGALSFSDSGSSFIGLSVKGFANINDNVAPNTKITIAGLGTLWLHRVIRTSHSIEVRMIELIITEQNTVGINVGTDIRVARAEASAH